jgi:hypothetical protein
MMRIGLDPAMLPGAAARALSLIRCMRRGSGRQRMSQEIVIRQAVPGCAQGPVHA